jgi:tRNA (guanosine-2'-O-)-methyltransferase
MSEGDEFDHSFGGMILDRRVERLRSVLEHRLDDLEVVIEDVHDPHNASAILRSVDAFGATGVTMIYRRAEQPKISKMVSGRIHRWVRVHRRDDPGQACSELRQRGLKIFVTALDDAAVSYLEVDWTQPCAVVLGGEREGCSAQMLAAADELVTIPMLGFGQSLNVSVAGAVILGEASRQRMDAGMYEPSWSEEKEQLLRSWLEREIPTEGGRERRGRVLGQKPERS